MMIKEELGDKNVRIMTIGQAGENLVRFACVITGIKNAAGRTGMGAVMGSKNLKAIAVRGKTPFKLANPKQYLEDLRETNKKASGTGWGKALGTLGTPLLLKNANKKGFTSYKYHQATHVTDPAIEELYAESLNEKYAKGMASCFGCPIHCRHRYEVTDGVGKGTKGEGPEYATIAAFGPTVGNLNLSSVLKLNDLCNRFGIDTISGGDYLGYFFKLYQEGIITEKDVGYPLEWGNHESIERLLRDIAHRRGFGAIAAEGSLAWKKLPNSEAAEKELLAIKNVSIEMTDERPVIVFAFGLAVATRERVSDEIRPMLGPSGVSIGHKRP
jgi:aldehyde:ferredoxin oxidoreductase